MGIIVFGPSNTIFWVLGPLGYDTVSPIPSHPMRIGGHKLHSNSVIKVYGSGFLKKIPDPETPRTTKAPKRSEAFRDFQASAMASSLGQQSSGLAKILGLHAV